MDIKQKERLNSKGFAHSFLIIVIVIIIVLAVALFVASQIKVTDEFAFKGLSVPQVLAHEDDTNGSSGSGSSGSGSSGSGSSKSDSREEESPKPVVSPVPSKTPEANEDEEDEKVETELGENEMKVEVESGGVKVRYKVENGQVKVRVENEMEAEGEEEEEELIRVEAKLKSMGIKIATESGKIVLAKNSVGALTNFPLRIDLNTNKLIVTTPNGTKEVAVLPDAAVQNMLAAKAITKVAEEAMTDELRNLATTGVSQVVTLTERKGKVVYEVEGVKEHRLLGLLPISMKVKVFVSSENGQLVAKEQTLLSKILDFISFN